MQIFNYLWIEKQLLKRAISKKEKKKNYIMTENLMAFCHEVDRSIEWVYFKRKNLLRSLFGKGAKLF